MNNTCSAHNLSHSHPVLRRCRTSRTVVLVASRSQPRMAWQERVSATLPSGKGPFPEAIRRVQARSRREGRQVFGRIARGRACAVCYYTHPQPMVPAQARGFVCRRLCAVTTGIGTTVTRRYPNYCSLSLDDDSTNAVRLASCTWFEQPDGHDENNTAYSSTSICRGLDVLPLTLRRKQALAGAVVIVAAVKQV